MNLDIFALVHALTPPRAVWILLCYPFVPCFKERKTKGQYKRLPRIRRGKPLFMRFSLLKADGIVFYAAPSFGGVFLRLDAFDNTMPEGTLALGA